MTAGARLRNPRIVAHELLMKLKEWAKHADYTWSSPPSLRYYADEPGGTETYHREPRKRADIRPEEYPENNPDQWEKLARYARAISLKAQELEAHALRERAAARRRLESLTEGAAK